jgi:hypothetical protein
MASNTQRWERGFAALSKFRAREGHYCPSKRHLERGFKLGQWVSVQRYLKDFVPVDRKRRPDKIGFVWDWRDDLWDRGFTVLLKFKRREGHCHVPALHREGKYKLGYWVSTRRKYKKDMSAERRARLNKIGFVWNENRGARSHRARTHRNGKAKSSSLLYMSSRGRRNSVLAVEKR